MRRLLRLLPVMAVSLAAAGAVAAPAAASAPAISLSPASLTFGSQAIGTTSAAQTITATNTGTASLFFNNVATTGDSLDFTIGNDGCIGTTLAAGNSCTVSVTFSPTMTGTRTADVNFTDNAANSPQTVPLTGGGTGTPAPLAIDGCSVGVVCVLADGANVFVSNFFSTGVQASGGTSPYTWSGQVPAGLTLRPSGLILGDPTTLGTTTFPLTVTDAAGDTVTETFSLTVTSPPAPAPKGCKTLGTASVSLTGPAIGGQTPSGTATANETKFGSCGGYTLLTVQVKNVNLPNGTVLWVTLSQIGAAGEITLSGGAGTMPQYNVGRFGVIHTTPSEQVTVYDSLPDVGPFQEILSGGNFS